MTASAMALRAGQGLGGFFALDVGPDLSGWRPLRELVDGERTWRRQVATARSTLAANAGVHRDAIDPRVAASLTQLGLAARLVSPALAAMASASWVPDLELARLHWQPAAASPVPIAVAELSGQAADGPAALAHVFDQLVVSAVLEPVNSAIVSTGLSSHIVWGNTWSALAGALTPIALHRRDLLAAARAIVAAILEDRQDAGGIEESTGRYRRATCCLYYRLPRGGLCGDCVLDVAPAAAPS